MRAVSRGLLLAATAFLLLVGAGPHVAGYRVLTVLTGSMAPAVPEGSLAIVTPVPLAEVRRGDVISYHSPVDDRRVVTHRVVEIDGQGTPHPTVVTKGDANRATDPWRARLLGRTAWKVRAVVPRAGHAVRALRSPWVRVVALWAVPALLAAVWLSAIWKPGRSPDAEPVPQV